MSSASRFARAGAIASVSLQPTGESGLLGRQLAVMDHDEEHACERELASAGRAELSDERGQPVRIDPPHRHRHVDHRRHLVHDAREAEQDTHLADVGAPVGGGTEPREVEDRVRLGRCQLRVDRSEARSKLCVIEDHAAHVTTAVDATENSIRMPRTQVQEIN